MKNILAINSLIILLSLGLLSCHDSSNKDFSTKSKVIADLKYELTYMPKKGMEVQDKDSIKIADLAYYKLTITDESKQGKIADFYRPSNYNKLLFYINKNIQGDFTSQYDEKEISPIQVYFENSNKINQKLVFLLAFEKFSPQCENVLIQFNDNIFNNGLIKFNYKTKDLNTL